MWLLIMTSADADRFYIFSPGFSEKFSFLHTELYSPIQRQYSLEEGKYTKKDLTKFSAYFHLVSAVLLYCLPKFELILLLRSLLICFTRTFLNTQMACDIREYNRNKIKYRMQIKQHCLEFELTINSVKSVQLKTYSLYQQRCYLVTCCSPSSWQIR